MRRTVKSYREEMGEAALSVRGLIRRFTIGAAAAATSLISTWSILGFVDSDDNEEADDVEIFQGVGFASRPPAGTNAEVIVANVGAKSNHPVIVAARDEETRSEKMTDLDSDEATIYNSLARVIVLNDGAIEVRTHAGTAIALATKADIDALTGHVDGHTHAGLLGGTGSAPALTSAPTTNPAGTPLDPAPAPMGTTKLRGE